MKTTEKTTTIESSNTKTPTILVIGGYGNTGRIIVKLLFQHCNQNINLIVAGRNLERAQATVEELRLAYPDAKSEVEACYVDATSSSKTNLAKLFTNENVTLVVLAAPSPREIVTEAALIAGIDYMDVQYSTEKMDILRSYEKEIQSKHLCFVTECGLHPGLPALLIRAISKDFLNLKSAIVGSVIKVDYNNLGAKLSSETMEEFATEITNAQMLEYKNRKWVEGSIMHLKKMDFGFPFGEQQCIPMYLEELQDLTSNQSDLVETGFYVGGLNYVVDNIIIPIAMLVLWMWPSKTMKNLMGKLLFWGLQTFSKPPYGTILQVEANGIGRDDDGKEIQRTLSVSHPDGYALTAISVAALVIQYLGYNISNGSEKENSSASSSIRRPGLWLQGSIAEPKQLLEDMAQMGVIVRKK